MPAINRWRSIWISDVHLGSKHAQVDALLEFLRDTRSDYLYIVRDLIDGWELRRRWFWSANHNTLIQKLLRKQRKHTRVIYLTGNHDEFLEPFLGLRFGGLELCREAIHQAADGRRYLVVHGHQFDGLTHFNRLLERVGARLYDRILDLNLWLNRLRRRLGLGLVAIGLSQTARQTGGAVHHPVRDGDGAAGRGQRRRRHHRWPHPPGRDAAHRRAALSKLRRLGGELYRPGGRCDRTIQPDPLP